MKPSTNEEGVLGKEQNRGEGWQTRRQAGWGRGKLRSLWPSPHTQPAGKPGQQPARAGGGVLATSVRGKGLRSLACEEF